MRRDLRNVAALSAADRVERLRDAGLSRLCPDAVRIAVGMGTCGRAAGAGEVFDALCDGVLERCMDAHVVKVGCRGLCWAEPLVEVQLPGHGVAVYGPVEVSRVGRMLDSLACGELYEKGLLLVSDFDERVPLGDALVLERDPAWHAGTRAALADDALLDVQKRRVMSRLGRIAPTSVEEYAALGGYAALVRVVESMTPEEAVAEVEASGLRGRGGAGFPTGRKWRLVAGAEGASASGGGGVGDADGAGGAGNVDDVGASADGGTFGSVKYVIANADEGDPGAFMDRGILEGDPHAVIEGMIIAGYAVGARQGYVYTRSEYPLAAETLRGAIDQAREAGILGAPLNADGFTFDVNVVVSGGAYVCGEGTALVRALEGYPGRPRKRPPHLTERGLWGCPTCMNNVETLANVPLILARGAEWYRRVGTEESPGTKIFSIAGDTPRPGLVEVSMGTPVSELYDALGVGANAPPDTGARCAADARGAGAPAPGPGDASAAGGTAGAMATDVASLPRVVKALQIGGPSGVILPASQDFGLDFESLDAFGGSIGSGGVVLLGERSCIVDTVRYLTTFCEKESCGQCAACRDGLARASELLRRFSEGEAGEDDVAALVDVARTLEEGSLCGLGRMAARPIQSSLRFFADEFAAHVRGSCPGLVCKKLIRFYVDERKCIGCRCCKPTCPTNAMKGRYGKPSNIVERLCIRCWMCTASCPYGAVCAETGE